MDLTKLSDGSWVQISSEHITDDFNKNLNIFKKTFVLSVGAGTVLKTTTMIWDSDKFIDCKESLVYLPDVRYFKGHFSPR